MDCQLGSSVVLLNSQPADTVVGNVNNDTGNKNTPRCHYRIYHVLTKKLELVECVSHNKLDTL